MDDLIAQTRSLLLTDESAPEQTGEQKSVDAVPDFAFKILVPGKSDHCTSESSIRGLYLSVCRWRSSRFALPWHLSLRVRAGHTAGCLIGKGGATISAIQTLTDTKIKLSQSNEYFPGTNDRVGLVTGDSIAVRDAVQEVLRRLSEVCACACMILSPALAAALVNSYAILLVCY